MVRMGYKPWPEDYGKICEECENHQCIPAQTNVKESKLVAVIRFLSDLLAKTNERAKA